MSSHAPLDCGEEGIGHIEFAGFLDGYPIFASVHGIAHLLSDHRHQVELHDGLLCACSNKEKSILYSGGEDGKIRSLGADGSAKTLWEKPGWWIDKIASGPSGAIAFGTGKKGIILQPDSQEKPFESERSIEGFAFAPKGLRLAVARYNGVDLHWVNTANQPQFLEWKGAHTGVVFSPDGKYVVSMMQENALHGWRLADNKHMRMSGYPAKVKSVSFSHKGKWLATSGAPAAIVWPFSGKDGPMGKAPKELGLMGELLVTQVKCHPQEEVIAIGYSDGSICAVRIQDGKLALLKRSGKGGISALAWDHQGKRIAYGSQSGEAGIIDLKGE